MGRAKGATQAIAIGARFDMGMLATRRGDEPSETAAEVNITPAAPSGHQQVVDRLGFGALLSGRAGAELKVVRSLKRTSFVEDIQRWKEQENSFIDGAHAELQAGMLAFAQDNQQWAAFQRLVARSHYSQQNELWARIQLRRRFEKLVEAGEDPQSLGDPGDGIFVSPSTAKALGGRVKDEYFKRATGEWDDRYAVEMSQPLSWEGFPENVLDPVTRQPVLDGKGKPKTRWVKTRPKDYKTFTAYHSSALVDATTGEPWAAPTPPWENTTGDEQAGRKLLEDMNEAFREEGLTVSFVDGFSSNNSSDLPEHARYDAEARTVVVDSSQPVQEQAVSALRALCEHVAAPAYTPKDADAAERNRKASRAAAESAKYAVASLYGLQSDRQTFPFLAELAADPSHGPRSISKVASDAHNRVKRVLTYLDPAMRAKSRAEGERKARAAARKSPKKSAAKRSRAN